MTTTPSENASQGHKAISNSIKGNAARSKQIDLYIEVMKYKFRRISSAFIFAASATQEHLPRCQNVVS